MTTFISDVRRTKIRHAHCGGHARHWFSIPGEVGNHTDKCVRCGAACPCRRTDHIDFDAYIQRRRARK